MGQKNKKQGKNGGINKGILFVAFHFPPIASSSGYLRTLAFSKYLQQHGWQTTVLSASLKAYERWLETNLDMIPSGVEVIRAFARDTRRHLSFGGRYWARMAIPDKWQSWIPFGVLAGLWHCWRHKPKAIISTYPIASAHAIGYWLHRLSGLPWVVDLRDPMAQADYPRDPIQHAAFERLEKKIFAHADKVITTTQRASNMYAERFPDKSHIVTVIQNGFDENLFAETASRLPKITGEGPFVLLHSGVIYPEERDPRCLFQALAKLKTSGVVDAGKLRVRLRASGNEQRYQSMIDELGIKDLIELADALPYRDALTEMCQEDGLLLLQADSCDAQIPAKAYEYLRAGRPVLALTNPVGETGRLVQHTHMGQVASLHDADAIATALTSFLSSVGDWQPPEAALVQQYSRQHAAGLLANMLDSITGQRQESYV